MEGRILNMRRKSYEDLSFLPGIIASTVCGREYRGEEMSLALRSQRTVERVEGLRRAMTQEQVDEFGELADERCKAAYEGGMPWFDEVVKARGDRGRELLYMWITHWMAAYLVSPETMRRESRRRREQAGSPS
jgi:hypothetical protein